MGRTKIYLSKKISPITEACTLEIDLIGLVAFGPSMTEPFEPTKINVHEHKDIPPKYKLHPRMPKGLRHPTEVRATFEDAQRPNVYYP